ncbi:hypothetical protein CEJ42_15995 [Herbaspirillum robiniae]|uniref:DNA-binding protein n=2 Tax=Herbaspirillum robiniae TaxID=2014887 RepID=A0A246WP38_9BURK|nr:hypothetical protein CEJ42_15995 [Herbaspirillum robiniae]
MPRNNLSPDEIKALFRRHGETLGNWADAHGFKRQDVYSVLNGKTRGYRGEAHRIFVALGMKARDEVVGLYPDEDKITAIDNYLKGENAQGREIEA